MLYYVVVPYRTLRNAGPREPESKARTGGGQEKGSEAYKRGRIKKQKIW